MPTPRVVVGFCTFNRAAGLDSLIGSLRAQQCDERFELLVVDNNSTDGTHDVLKRLASADGPKLRVVQEMEQGIVPARNRLLQESAAAEFLLMLDDDERPLPGWVQGGLTALRDEGLDCVGGRVRVVFPGERPDWIGDNLLGFLAEVNYGAEPLAVTSVDMPIWTANIGYRTSLFAPGLRFDHRFSRVGKGVGGGEDVAMFETLVAQGRKIGYRPAMIVEHHIERWRLRRSYFLRTHYANGVRQGLYDIEIRGAQLHGVPRYLFALALKHAWRAFAALVSRNSSWLRQTMTFTHTCGVIVGASRRQAEES